MQLIFGNIITTFVSTLDVWFWKWASSCFFRADRYVVRGLLQDPWLMVLRVIC